MKATDVVLELGDPDSVCGQEDHVVLKLSEPWRSSSAPSSLPKGLVLDKDGNLIITTTQIFLEYFELLSTLDVVAALFAGCASFESSEALITAARAVLLKTERLVIVHNRDNVLNLVDWFRSVEVLVLHHDIKLHGVGLPIDWSGVSGPNLPRLTRLLGSTPALGTQNLFLTSRTICALFMSCPRLNEVQTSLQDLLVPDHPLRIFLLSQQRSLSTMRSLILGGAMEMMDGGMTTLSDMDITPEHMIFAHRLCGNIKRMEVLATMSMDTVAHISRFTKLTELSLMLPVGDNRFPFGGALETSLKQLRLKYLSLRYLEGVSLTAIAKHCPGLETLLISECTLAEDEEQLSPGSFSALATLRMGFTTPSDAALMFATQVLLKTSEQLVELRVDGAAMCSCFIKSCPDITFRRLELLTLATERPLPELQLAADDLNSLPIAMPFLRHAVTDSYDIRLFFQFDMPHVNLHWSQCTVCMAEYPLLDETQARYWKMLHTGFQQ